jgi:hypothetical protein
MSKKKSQTIEEDLFETNDEESEIILDDEASEEVEELAEDILSGLDDDDELASVVALTDKNFMNYDDFAEGIEDISLDSEQFINMVIYGPQGVGKTSFAATCPDPIVFDLNEKGTSVLIGTGAKRRRIYTFEMIQKGYWFLKNGKHNFETAVLDTMTMAESIALNYVMGKGAEMDASKDKEMPTIRDYGSRSLLMKRLILDFRNLDMNTVFVVQERKSKEDDIQSDDPSVFPDLSAAVGVFINAAVDIVGRMYTKEKTIKKGNKTETIDEYFMRLKGNQIYKAKCRVPRGAYCPRIIKDPTFDKIRSIYMGEYKKGEKK